MGSVAFLRKDISFDPADIARGVHDVHKRNAALAMISERIKSHTGDNVRIEFYAGRQTQFEPEYLEPTGYTIKLLPRDKAKGFFSAREKMPGPDKIASAINMGMRLAGIVPNADHEMRVAHKGWSKQDAIWISESYGMALLNSITHGSDALTQAMKFTDGFCHELSLQRKGLSR